jgi:circadian clock protein KaiB
VGKTEVAGAADKKYTFILFISGMSSKSIRAIENIKKIIEEHLKGECELSIVDISKDRQLAVQYQLIGLPTLIRTKPAPQRMIIGDLSDTKKVLHLLNINV